jgi:hypothetical protein
MSLHVLAYNLKRVINILGIARTMKAVSSMGREPFSVPSGPYQRTFLNANHRGLSVLRYIACLSRVDISFHTALANTSQSRTTAPGYRRSGAKGRHRLESAFCSADSLIGSPMSLPTRLLAFVWISGIIAVALGAFAPNGYAQYVLKLPEPHPYPYSLVGLFFLIVTAETLALAVVVRPSTYRASWGRALFALLLALAAAFAHGMTLMHAPPYMVWHVLWLFAVCIGFAIAFGVSASSAAHAFFGARRAANPSSGMNIIAMKAGPRQSTKLVRNCVPIRGLDADQILLSKNFGLPSNRVASHV